MTNIDIDYRVWIDRILGTGPSREQLVELRAFFNHWYNCGRDEAEHQARDECRNMVSARAWQVIRDLVFDRDGYQCRYCGSFTTNPHCDHIVPLGRGGTTVARNLATACSRCNSSKRDKLLSEWRHPN